MNQHPGIWGQTLSSPLSSGAASSPNLPICVQLSCTTQIPLGFKRTSPHETVHQHTPHILPSNWECAGHWSICNAEDSPQPNAQNEDMGQLVTSCCSNSVPAHGDHSCQPSCLFPAGSQARGSSQRVPPSSKPRALKRQRHLSCVLCMGTMPS